MDTFWQWESKVSEQEVDYYEALLRNLKMQIDDEIAERLNLEGIDQADKYTEGIAKKKLTANMKRATQIVQEVEDKHAEKKRILVAGYERAKTEEIVIHKQKDYRKYEKLFEAYAFPVNRFKVQESTLIDAKQMVEEERNSELSKI